MVLTQLIVDHHWLSNAAVTTRYCSPRTVRSRDRRNETASTSSTGPS